MSPTLTGAAPDGPVTTIELDDAGHLRRVSVDDLQASLFVPTPHDDPPTGLWLRRREGSDARAVHLTSTADGFGTRDDGDTAQALWRGTALGLSYCVQLAPLAAAPGLRWDVWLEPASGTTHDPEAEFDLVAVHDVALSPAAAARTNELYTSHYVVQHLTHPTDGDDRDVVVVSRQAMSVAPRLPLQVLTWLGGARQASTDGFDLAGTGVRVGAEPDLLARWDWPTRVRQYEQAQAALASSSFPVAGPVHRAAALVVAPDHPGSLDDVAALIAAAGTGAPTSAPPHAVTPRPVSLLATAPLLDADLAASAPDGALLVETGPQGELSWFDADAAHTVSGAKEAAVERSHGQIMLSADSLDPAVASMTSTVFAPGVFASHVALGNTNLHRVVDVHRDSLNLLRSSGLRLLVDEGDGLRLLGVPSTFTMRWGSAEWSYRTPRGTIRVRAVMGSGQPVLRVRLDATHPVTVVATLSLDADTGPWSLADRTPSGGTAPVGRGPDGSDLTVVPASGNPAAPVTPGLSYAIGVPGGWHDDRGLWSDGMARTDLRVARSGNVRHFEVAFAASEQSLPQALDLLDAARAVPFADWASGAEAAHQDFCDDVAGLHLDTGDARVGELAMLQPWLAHDAVVHFLSPHGLEQFSGAAWGTRDVCQGPFELALATGRPDVARDVLLRVFDHQFTSGTFPQWFMFDAHRDLYQQDSHGDVPVWPLLALGEYLAQTGDLAVVHEQVGWLDGQGNATVLQHARRALDHIAANTVPGTGLYAFGEGDWDDTLQPANPAERTGMVSSWTLALLIEACDQLASHLPSDDETGRAARELGTATHEAFDRLLVVDSTVPGLARFTSAGTDYLIHPRDTTTNEQHRLISLTQALLGGLLSASDQQRALDDVADHLAFADGVRLMDRPMAWHDGVPQVFRRAEQSAFFGREVGLMYTHAHLRWVQMLAMRHDPHALEVLLQVVPVQVHERLGATALPRQRNCYYSSSDARFLTRQEASDQWAELRAGRVPVAGGWRVYSSGPGIMLRLLNQELVGVHRTPTHLVLRPGLPSDVGPVTVHLRRPDLTLRLVHDLDADASPRLQGAPAEVDAHGVRVAWPDLDAVTDLVLHLPQR